MTPATAEREAPRSAITDDEKAAAEYLLRYEDLGDRASAFARIEQLVKAQTTAEEAEAGASAAEGAAKAERIAKVRKAFIEDAEDNWTADAEQARVEIPGSCGLFWKGQATHIFAPRESGKTTVQLFICCLMAAEGTRVAMFDRENGGAPNKEKLDDILAAHPEWDARDGPQELHDRVLADDREGFDRRGFRRFLQRGGLRNRPL